jgi:hypothetical protein
LPPLDLADRIAQRAFRQGYSWDALIISWLRPGPALATLAVMLVLFSFLWLMPGSRQIVYSEYEKLMEEVDAINLEASALQIHNDSELVMWLEQEGNQR